MTLDELADFICGKVNQTETEDVAACKGFLTRRHEMIWNEALWKDSLVEYRQTLDPDAADYTPASNYLPTKGVLLLPPIVQRVLAARTSERVLNIQRPEYFYRIDYDAFSKTGAAAEYILLPPCVWELDEARNTYALRAGASDAATMVTADLADSDSTGETRTSKVLDEDEKLLGETERLATITKPTSTGQVNLAAYGDNLVSGVYGDYIGSLPYRIQITGLAIGETYYFSPEDDAYVGLPASLSYISTGQAGEASTGGTFVATASTVYLANSLALGVVPTAILQQRYTLVTAAAADTNFKKRQRLRLVEIPTTSTTLRVLGKRVCPTFTSDNDEPAINGMDNLLIAFGMADMLQRERQYGKARELQSEAMLLLKQLKEIEVVQQAHHSRIIPECGFGDDYFTGRVRGFHF